VFPIFRFVALYPAVPNTILKRLNAIGFWMFPYVTSLLSCDTSIPMACANAVLVVACVLSKWFIRSLIDSDLM
jgi:hypothetical protein